MCPPAGPIYPEPGAGPRGRRPLPATMLRGARPISISEGPTKQSRPRVLKAAAAPCTRFAGHADQSWDAQGGDDAITCYVSKVPPLSSPVSIRTPPRKDGNKGKTQHKQPRSTPPLPRSKLHGERPRVLRQAYVDGNLPRHRRSVLLNVPRSTRERGRAVQEKNAMFLQVAPR